MLHRTKSDIEVAEQGIEAPDGSTRPRYWWTVPERPGVGRSMFKTIIIWFVTLLALIVLGAVLA